VRPCDRCPAGYGLYGSPPVCVQCPAGTYSPGGIQGPCLSCPSNRRMTAVGRGRTAMDCRQSLLPSGNLVLATRSSAPAVGQPFEVVALYTNSYGGLLGRAVVFTPSGGCRCAAATATTDAQGRAAMMCTADAAASAVVIRGMVGNLNPGQPPVINYVTVTPSYSGGGGSNPTGEGGLLGLWRV
jgi:hypothetical protein